MENLKGRSLVGMSTSMERVKNDYYATPYESTKALLDNVNFEGNFLEPCVGGGHIADVIKQYYNSKIYCIDIVDRGYPNTLLGDFLKVNFKIKFDNIITNPPYSLAQEFLEKSMNILNDNGKIALFLKIQFLEGIKRKKLFIKYPPKFIYVFSKRQTPWREGKPFNEDGKPWNSTMCFAWFVWEKNFKGETIVKWI